MKVLWLCNMMLPSIAEQLHRTASNKEGWLAGLSEALCSHGNSDMELAIAFPTDRELQGCCGTLDNGIMYFGFYEDVSHPEKYDDGVEGQLKVILDKFQPDVIHCFGAEFPHTLAMCRVAPQKEKILLTIQGICFAIAQAYDASLPKEVIRRRTFRDRIKKDSIAEQKAKFVQRGIYEKEAISLCVNIAGRTKWDREQTKNVRQDRNYYVLNETLRAPFYDGQWQMESCKPYRIFLSQGDYPLKGLHYAIAAISKLRGKYPEIELVVAGNPIIRPNTIKGNLKISSYGKYIRDLIQETGLEEKVTFLGSLSCLGMKEQMLRSHIFLCASALENSSNSLGEAMLLGMPCVTAAVGGIPTIFEGGVDGISFEGYTEEDTMEEVAARTAMALDQMLSDTEKAKDYGRKARAHGLKTHDGKANVEALLEVYKDLM